MGTSRPGICFEDRIEELRAIKAASEVSAEDPWGSGIQVSSLGRPLKQLIFSLMALIRDPIY